jgi:outer membrane receptor protein involved in Fe transport
MERLTAEVGLRWDDQTYDQVDDGSQLSPRINLLYDWDDATEIRASWGRFYQAQGIDELQVEDGIDYFLPAQRADHAILSLEHVFASDLHLRLEAYYKNYEELKPRFENQFDPLVLLPELQTDRIEVDAGSGDVRGVELLLSRRDAGPWGWWLSYAWSRAEDDVAGSTEKRSWDQAHSFNGGVNWARGPWNLTLAGTYHTGWPTTPVALGPLVEGPDGPGDLVPSVVLGPRNSTRFEYFGSLDLRASYKFALPASELLTFVEFTNTYGRKNQCCVQYTVEEQADGNYVLQSDINYWLRFVPNLGVVWRF